MPARRVRLTDKFLEALEAPNDLAVSIDYTDEVTPGLALRLTPSGTKSWSFRFRNRAGKTTRRSLGPYPDVKLAKARVEAGKLREKLRDGIDITAPARETPAGSTFAAVVERWERRQKRQHKRSTSETRRILNIHVVPELGDRAIESIRRRDVIDLLERLGDEKGLHAQVNRVQRAISGVLGYAVDADLIEANPLAGLKPQVKELERERVLSVDELVKVWKAAEHLTEAPKACVRLFILTGQRREEVTGMSRLELDYDWDQKIWKAGGLWTIAAARYKSKRDHIVPLSAAARDIIAEQPRGAAGEFIFSANFGRTSFAGWRRAATTLAEKAALDTPWTLHDLRRSFATGLGDELNIDESIIQRLLGHASRSRMGVTARYERSERLAQMRAAVDAWAELITGRVEGRRDEKVVAIGTAAAAAKVAS